MASKNNLHLKQTKTADRTPHYGLRKLSVGVASVLLSTTLYLGTTAQADTVPTGDESQNTAVSSVADSAGSSSGTLMLAQSAGSTADTQSTTYSAASQATSNSSAAIGRNTESTASASSASESTANNQNTVTSAVASSADPTAEPAVNTVSVSDSATTTLDLSSSAADLVTDSALTTSLTTSTAVDTTANTETPDISKWTYNVVPNGTANEIVLTGYTGTDSTIIVPNAVDFANAGASISNGTVYLTYDLTRKLATTSGVTKLIISSNGDAKVVACGNSDPANSLIIGDANWHGAFLGTTLSSMDLRGLDTSQVTNMRNMFADDSNLTSLDASNWDTSKVTDIGGMFNNCNNLTFLNVSNWDTSKVTDMGYTFNGCNNLTSLDTSEWDTSKVTNMCGIFTGCSNLTSLDVLNWDTSKVTNMAAMFGGCSKLTSLDVSKWNTSSVTNVRNMFAGDSNLTFLDVSKWNTSNVTDMGGMFNNCNNLTSLDVLKWDTSKVTDMGYMFNCCSNLISLDASEWDTSKVTNMRGIFTDCSNLTSLNVSNWDTSKVTNMNVMFDGCSKLTSLDLSNWNTSKTTDMSSMFYVEFYVPLEVITKDSRLLAYDYVSDNRASKLQFKADADDATLSSNNAQTDSKTLTVAYTPEQANNSTLTSKIDQLADDSTNNYQQLAKTYQATIKANPGLSAELAAAFDAVSNESATRPNYGLVAFNPTDATLGQVAALTSLLNGTYTAEWKKAAKSTVEFVDDDNNGAVVGTPVVLNGYVDDVKSVSMALPASYELVSGQTIPTSVTLSGANDTVQIHLKHQIQTIADNDPMNHTAFRVTVHYKKDGQTNTFMPDTVITTKYKRTTTKDLVTGKYTATPFVLDSITQTGTKIDGLGTPAEGVVKDVPAGWQYFTYSIPYNVSVPGWHQVLSGSSFTDMIGVAAGTSAAMKTAELTAIYAANTQTTHIKYVDANGTTVKTDTVSGKTGTTQTVNSTVPVGWKMTTPQTIPTSVTFDDNGVPDTTITIEHDHVAVSHDKPQTTGTQIPNGAAKFKGVANSDLNKTVTRTVTITSPNGNAKTTTQTFTSTRDAVVDMVDGSVVYSDWTQGKWDAVDVPVYDHYTVSQTSVPEQTVNGSTADSTVNVTYTANTETVTVQWVDDTEDGKVVYSTNVSLQPGRKTDVWVFGLDENGHASTDAVALSGMYNLVSVSDTNVLQSTNWPGYYNVFDLVMPSVDNWIDGNTYTVHLTHKISATDGYSSPTKIALRTTNSERYPNLMYTDDAAWSKTHKDVLRTITVVKPDGSQSTTTQKLAFSRQAQYDMVTGEFKGYTDWKEGTQTFAAYTPAAIAGYTAGTVPTATATGDYDNLKATVGYMANAQTAKIVYVDKDGNTIKTDTINGVTDQTVSVNSTVPAGWRLSTGQMIPATIKLSANTPDTKIIVEHDHVTITPDNPQTDGTDIPNGTAQFKGVSENDLNQTLTRTIKINDPHTGVKAITQTAKISRNATVDMIDGSVVYGDWSTAEWPEYVAPTVAGYTPTQTLVEQKTVKNGNQDELVTIDYLADSQTVQINYVYNGQVVKSDSVDGYTDDVVAFTPSVPTGYKLADSAVVPSSITMTANPADVTIAVVHDHVSISHDKPQTDGTQIPNGAAKFKGVSDSDLNKTITRTINIEQPDGTAKTVKQEAKLTRDAVVDMVDGSVVYGDWSTSKWNAFDVPEIEHYTADQTQVAEQTVTVNNNDTTVNIAYTVNDETVTVQWIDDETGETLYLENVTAKPNVTKPVYAYGVDSNGKASDDMLYLQAYYELVSVSDTSVLTLIDSTMSRYFDAYNVVFPSVDNWINGNTYSVHLKHHVVTVSGMDNPTSEVFRNTNTARYPKLMFTEDAAMDKTNHTVTRTIVLHQPSGDKTVTQSADFKRGANYDAVNGKFLGYTDWRGWPTTLSSYEVPTVDGYTANIREVPSLEISGDSADQTVEINYTANAQTTHVIYVDQNGNQIKSDDVDGHTDETVKVTSKVPAGWVLADGQSVPESITFGASTPDVKVVVKHVHVTVTPDASKTSSDKLPDNVDKNYPNGVDYSDLNKTVTRTINVHNLDGTVTPIVQTAHLTRTADVDEVDGTVTYGEWTTGTWDKFASTPIDGYTVSLTELSAAEVSSATANTSFDVIYTANSQSMRINYVDENGQTVDSTIVNGHTDETVTINSKVPAGWTLVAGQNVPTEITFKGAKTADVEVKVEHAHVTVQPNDPKTSADKLPDNSNKNYPNGVGYDDLNKTITRTIEIDEPNGNIVFVPKQEVHYTRTADVDEVSGTVTYGDWTTKDQFAEFANVPTFAGYTSSQNKVDAVVPSVDDSDSAVKITYTANEQSMQIVYVDENGQTVKTDTVKGHTDETVTTNSTVPAGWTTENTVPVEITFKGAKTDNITIKVKHAYVTVTPDKPKTANDKLPDNADKDYPSGVDYSDLNKTVKRTIIVHNVDGTATTVEQKVHFTRTADVDEVNGTVEYGSWQADKQFDQYAVPAVPGYVSMIDGKEQTMIQPAVPNVNDNDSTIDVTYQAVDGSQTIDYVDENGTVIGYQIITGKTAETKSVKSAVPTGWKLADGQTVPATVTIKANDVPVKVLIEHDHVAVSHDKAQKDGTRIPGGATVFNGVADNDLNQTLARTITVNDPHKGTQTITQTAKISRNATVDMVDGTVKYGDWSTAEWPAYAVPTVDGYTPNQATVESKTITDGDKDVAVTINYTADKQTAKIVYADENGNAVKTDTVAGVTDQTVDTNSSVPVGWKLIDGQTIPAMIKLGVNTPDVMVKIQHDHVSINHDKPQADGTDIPGGAAKFNGVSDTDLNQTLTRTITVADPYKGNQTTVQTAKIHRNATVDMVDGTVKYGDWSTAKWPEYVAPIIAGYTPSQATVAEKPIANGDQDDTVTISYTADKQTAKIVYADENGNAVKTDSINGVTDQTVNTNSSVPTGWKLVDGQTIPTTIKLGVNTPDTMVKVEHDYVSISHDKSQTDGTDIPGGTAKFKGVSENNLNQTLTRTITINDPHAGTKTITQTAKISRDATVDMVDGSVVYGDWSTAQWPEYSVPTVDGYTPSQKAVEAKTVTNGDQDVAVTINYMADKQTAKIVYTDADDNPVKTDTVEGVTDQIVDASSTVPTGWKLVDGQTIPTTIKLGVNTPDTVIKIQHDHVSINHDKPQANGTDIPGGTAKFNGVADNDLNQTLTRTITVNNPYEGTKTITQTAKIYRAAVVDMVDGSVEYGEWSTTEWPKYTVPTVDGYTPSQAVVEKKTVANGDKDTAVTINYTADKQTTHVVYVDADDNPVKTDTVEGVTDQTVDTNSTVPTGWKLVDGQTVPVTIKLGVNTPDTVVKVQHAHVTVTPDAPKMVNDKLPDNADKTFPSGVAHDDLNQTFERTITIAKPDGTTNTVHQTAHFTRTADVDEVSGVVAYSDWTTMDRFDSYVVPAIPGYTASQVAIAQSTPIFGDNPIVEINYTANAQTAKIVYVDENGNVIKADTVNGVTDQTVDTNSSVPTGWKLVDGQTIPTTIKLGVNTPDTVVKIRHDHVSINHDKPQADGSNIPGGTAKFSGVSDNDLNQTLTRTITINDPYAGAKTIMQTAKISRNATVDMVDGSVKYGDWSTAEWPAYTVPTVDGYTPSQATIESKAVADGDKDDVVTIDYKADKQTAKIVYVDENGNVVKADTVSGKTDQIVDVNSSVPVGWKLADGQTMPVKIKLNVNTPDTIVKVEHNHVSINYDKPQTDGTSIPGGAAEFKGVADNDLNQTLTRTIIVKMPNGQTKALAQTAKLSRDAVVDMVDGTVKYGDWSTTQWNEYTAPVVDGYTPSQAVVEAESVINGMQNKLVTIDYTANDGTQTINYVDEDGNVIVNQTIHGKTDQEIAVNDDKPHGWVLENGQTVPGTVTIKAVDEPITVKIKHGIVAVAPDAPKTDADRMPNWPDKSYPAGVGYDDLNKTVTRTITFELPDGQTKTIKQTTTFTRHATVDEVTNAVVYSAWNEQSHTFDVVDVPTIDGWTASVEQVDGTIVMPDSEDEQVTVAYTVNPTAPKSEDKSADTPGQSEVANGSANTVFNESTTIQENDKTDSQAKANSQAKTDELPQTGNEQTNLQALAGLAMTGLAAMLGLGRKKRKNS